MRCEIQNCNKEAEFIAQDCMSKKERKICRKCYEEGSAHGWFIKGKRIYG